MRSHFQNNLRFALRKETAIFREQCPLNKMEKVGDALSWFAYDFKECVLDIIFDPRAMTVCCTAFAMILAALLFYPSYTSDILSKSFHWIVNLVNWNYVRFCLWLISEITIFGIGVRAFGRFSNQELLKQYHEQSVVAS